MLGSADSVGVGGSASSLPLGTTLTGARLVGLLLLCCCLRRCGTVVDRRDGGWLLVPGLLTERAGEPKPPISVYGRVGGRVAVRGGERDSQSGAVLDRPSCRGQSRVQEGVSSYTYTHTSYIHTYTYIHHIYTYTDVYIHPRALLCTRFAAS